MHYHCMTIDFDNTLGHFIGQGGSKGFFSIFEKRGIPHETVARCYESTKTANGFSLDRFFDELALQGIALLSHAAIRVEIQREFEEWLCQSLVLYPDSAPTLTWLRTRHIPICIITFGDDAFQRRKIELAHPPYDDIVVIPHLNSKADAERTMLARFGGPVIFIDDKRSELDAVREAGLTEKEVRTFHINRPDSPYQDQRAKWSHGEIQTLVELLPEFA
ncbi:MAG: hypothetical protein UY62_C0042G0015 [Parcubacteria group bacterium GW2011_GWF2_50_9]|nr:MAG: hypothetical protein UY62_C0042G0015 [Parcubacteria group bacterium GW2011_GWF2_50_9]